MIFVCRGCGKRKNGPPHKSNSSGHYICNDCKPKRNKNKRLKTEHLNSLDVLFYEARRRRGGTGRR